MYDATAEVTLTPEAEPFCFLFQSLCQAKLTSHVHTIWRWPCDVNWMLASWRVLLIKENLPGINVCLEFSGLDCWRSRSHITLKQVEKNFRLSKTQCLSLLQTFCCSVWCRNPNRHSPYHSSIWKAIFWDMGEDVWYDHITGKPLS